MIDRARAGLLAELAAAVHETHRDPILQVLHVGCGAAGIDATQAELDAAIRDHALVLHDSEEWR